MGGIQSSFLQASQFSQTWSILSKNPTNVVLYVNTILVILLLPLRNIHHAALQSDIYMWTCILLTLPTKCISTL